jgi:hypothetical protein
VLAACKRWTYIDALISFHRVVANVLAYGTAQTVSLMQQGASGIEGYLSLVSSGVNMFEKHRFRIADRL